MEDLYILNYKTLKKLKTIQVNGQISHAHKLEGLILLKCPYHPINPQMQCNPYQNPYTNGIFHINRTNNPKIYIEPQEIP